MPRRQPSRSTPADIQPTSPDISLPPPQHTVGNTEGLATDTGLKQPLGALLGENPQFADHFFGESSSMVRPLRPATPHEYGDHGDRSVNTHDGGSGPPSHANTNIQPANPLAPGSVGHSFVNVENTPVSIDHLVMQQLREDLDAYRYDLDFARSQLEPANAANISPAETRTFQLRMLDLGHQMRMLNHRLQLMQATMNNSRLTNSVAGRAGAAASNAYWGPYPPGTSLQPGAYGAGPSSVPIANGHYGQDLQSPATFSPYADYQHERRGPGRPLGSKNRPRQVQDPLQAPSVPANGSAKASALASAAALASAGAKRDHSSEIHVASPNGEASGTTDAVDSAAAEHPSKRIRLDVQVGSPMSNNPETDERPTQSVITAAGTNASRYQENTEDMTDGEMQLQKTIAPTPGRRLSGAGIVRPAPSGLAAPYGTPSAPVVPALPAGSPPYDGPAGNEFKRLGGWRCRLCTSQKYLNTPPPKQPSEPGHWPLRDISKMVTHFTRMHGEHNNVERCMELGAALGANRGPFKHWLLITKKEKGLDQDAIDTAVDQLENGRMPAILRKVSTSAANFPRD